MTPLPPGQRVRADFPRFGMTQFAARFPKRPASMALVLGGDTMEAATLDAPLSGLERVWLTCDFHCVTTWSCTGLRWSGVRFADFYRAHVVPRLRNGVEVRYVLLRGQDGYRTLLPLEDALAADILLADTLDERPLTMEHGAPLRVVAPAHYGYKQVKHLERIEFWEQKPDLKRGMLAFMEHPRGRVAFEERGSYFPGWLLRYLYRPLIAPAVAQFAEATARYKNKEA